MLIDNTVAITTWDDALNALDDIEDPPRDVLSWASAQLGRRFDAPCRPPPPSSPPGRRDSGSGGEAFYIAHLCGENGETRAYPILCRLIGEDGRIAEWLDDAVTETLPGILIRVFDGDAVLLRRAIESESGRRVRARLGARRARLSRSRQRRDERRRHARLPARIRRDMAPRRDSILWLTWATTVASLGYRDMRAEVDGLKRDNLVPDDDFNGEDFDLRIGLAQSDASGLAGFERDRVAPLIDATSAMLSLPGAEAAAAGRRLRALAQKAGDNRL